MQILTYSSTSSFKNCRKKYLLSYVEKLKSKDTPLYFSVGDAFHLGLELHYKGNDYDTCIDAIVSKMYESEPDIDDIEKIEKFHDGIILLKNMFSNYVNNYKNEPFEIVELEKEFTVPIINPETGHASRNYKLMGKVDGLIKENGKYWILEHKTASSIDNSYLKKLTMDNQSICYIEALKRSLAINIEGVLYNVVLKDFPKPPKMLKNGKLSTAKNQKTSPELFKEAIIDNDLEYTDYIDYIDYLEQNRKRYFYREYLTFSKKHIQEWRNELWDLQKDISDAGNKNKFYKNSANCVTVYGSCPFFDVCSSLDPEYIIDNNFIRKDSVHSELEKKEETPF